jgi:A/G-specific adenine glycosylase
MLPHARLADYTQAIMDLGATVCGRRAPRCIGCPVAADCVARLENLVDELPHRAAARPTPTRAALMLVVRDDDGRVLLERRAPTGVWGGLFSLPQCEDRAAASTLLAQRFGLDVTAPRELAPFTHAFTHFRLAVQPLAYRVDKAPADVADGDAVRWLSPQEFDGVGMPRPVRALLDTLGD